DNRRRFDNTRRVKLEIQKLKREEFLRQMRLEDRRNEFSDEEWDAMREESLRLQAERGIFIPPVKNKEEDDDERGQSDFYSGLDYQSDSIHDVSQNFATLRRENGKFGSHPNEDSYGEESRS
ncbi:MAG TPA: hypothetical protein VGQ59_08180, partial [Cyclobacteriaceae bacterium]|nr:hypothetical protein [Cyclobacteriaceae bacterium]